VAAEFGGESAQLDVTDARACDRVAQAVDTARDGIDIWASNAGISSMARFTDISEEEYDANLAVNLKGVFLAGQAAARVMIPRRRGAIVNTASMAGKRGAAPFLAHYVASKFGVVGLTQAMADELAEHSIRVNCVCQATWPQRCRSASSNGRPRSAASPPPKCSRCGWQTHRLGDSRPHKTSPRS
jgi:meso-butanediol dehydrogenase/(S,S)-butanediol dehydrogenase/diacetyl reductase